MSKTHALSSFWVVISLYFILSGQVEDMKTHFANLDRFKQLVKMLTIIFSLGQPMPVNHQGA